MAGATEISCSAFGRALAEAVQTLGADAAFAFTALQEYRRSVETRLGPAESAAARETPLHGVSPSSQLGGPASLRAPQ